MPAWARAAADVLGEQVPADNPHGWTYAYPIGVLLVPRQSAKTTTVLDVALGRGMVHRDYRAAYAAQTGHVTTERMGERIDAVARSPLGPRSKPRRSAGTERITYRPGAFDSYVKAYPPKDGALRSSALDLVIVDEAQEHDDDPLGRALDHTIMPTFTTRPRRQLLIIGTAPDRPGTMLGRYAALARAGTPGVALFDYGATPDEDLTDPATWWRRHPGLAAGLTDEAYLRSQLELDPAMFAREVMNVWPVEGEETGSKFTPGAWQAAAWPDDVEALPVVALAVDVAPDRDRSAVAAARRAPDGSLVLHVLATGPGASWLLDAVEALAARYGRPPVGYDTKGQTGAVVTSWPRSRLTLAGFDATGYVRACVDLAADVNDARVRVVPDPELDTAARRARARDADREWYWSRRSSPVDVSPLVAVALARAVALRPAPARPRVRARRPAGIDTVSGSSPRT